MSEGLFLARTKLCMETGEEISDTHKGLKDTISDCPDRV